MRKHHSSHTSHAHLVAILGACALAWSSLNSPQALASPTTAPQSGADASESIVDPDTVAAEHAAQNTAVNTGQATNVPELTTEYSSVTANPDGTFTMTSSVTPVRTRQADTWVDIDTTLAANPGGTLSPIASVAAIELSGGGDGPLARVQSDSGEWITLTWSAGALPSPQVDQDRATYPNVFPGVDLVLSAEAKGVSQVLVIHDETAAANPDLRSISFDFDSPGLTLEASGSAITATTASGEVAAQVATPIWWDSSTPGSSVSGPDQVGTPLPVPATINDTAITIDAAPADADGAVYPIYVDPYLYVGPADWTYVDSAYPNQNYLRSTSSHNDGKARVGYVPAAWSADGKAHTTRSYFSFQSAAIAGKQVLNATYAMWNTYSSSCTPRPVSIHAVGNFGPTTTWNNQPAIGGALDTQSFAYNYSSGACPAPGPVGWNVTAAAQQSASQGWSYLMFALVSGAQTDSLGWRVFDPAGTLTIHYNTTPNPPGTITVTPSLNYGTLAYVTHRPNPTLTTTTSDADGGNLWTTFYVYDTPGPWGSARYLVRQSPSIYTAQGTVSWAINPPLPDGHYWVKAGSGDGIVNGPDSTWYYFVIDTQAPAAASATFPPNQAGTTAESRAGNPHQPIDVTFTLPSGEALSRLAYSWTPPLPVFDQLPACGSSQSGATIICPAFGQPTATAQVRAPDYDATLYIQGWDWAGNPTPTTSIPVHVGRDLNALTSGHMWIKSSTGTAIDANTAEPKTLTLHHATFVDATNPNGDLDAVMAFNAPSSVARSTQLINHAQSFSVGAAFNLAAFNNEQTLLDTTGTNPQGIRITVGADQKVRARITSNGPPTEAVSAATLTSGDWFYVLAIWDARTSTLELNVLTINAAQAATTTVSSSPISNTTSDLTISSANAALNGNAYKPVFTPGFLDSRMIRGLLQGAALTEFGQIQ